MLVSYKHTQKLYTAYHAEALQSGAVNHYCYSENNINMKMPVIMRKSVEGKIARGFVNNRVKMFSMYILGGVTVGAFGFVYVNASTVLDLKSNNFTLENKPLVIEKVEKVETVEETIRRISGDFSEVDTLVEIAKCESSFNRLAENKVSSAKGIFQILNMHGLTAIERFDVEKSTKWAIQEATKNGFKAWASSKNCWSK